MEPKVGRFLALLAGLHAHPCCLGPGERCPAFPTSHHGAHLLPGRLTLCESHSLCPPQGQCAALQRSCSSWLLACICTRQCRAWPRRRPGHPCMWLTARCKLQSSLPPPIPLRPPACMPHASCGAQDHAACGCMHGAARAHACSHVVVPGMAVGRARLCAHAALLSGSVQQRVGMGVQAIRCSRRSVP